MVVCKNGERSVISCFASAFFSISILFLEFGAVSGRVRSLCDQGRRKPRLAWKRQGEKGEKASRRATPSDFVSGLSKPRRGTEAECRRLRQRQQERAPGRSAAGPRCPGVSRQRPARGSGSQQPPSSAASRGRSRETPGDAAAFTPALEPDPCSREWNSPGTGWGALAPCLAPSSACPSSCPSS